MTTEPTVFRAVTALVVTTVFWGISFPLVRMSNLLIADHFTRIETVTGRISRFDLDLSSAAASIGLRFGLALAVLAMAAGLRVVQLPRMCLAHWVMGCVVGTVCVAGLFLQVIALSEISASRSGLLTSLSVVFTPLFMIFVDWRRPPISVLVAVGCALLGVAIVTGVCQFAGPRGLALAPDFGDKIGLGDVLTILAAMLFAGQIILVDVFSQRMPPVLLTPGMFLAMFGAGLGAFLLHGAIREPAVPYGAWGELLATFGFVPLTAAICLICTVVPYLLMNRYQSQITPTQAAIIYTMEPVFAAIGAIILPALFSEQLGLNYPPEKITRELIGGGCLVLLANLLGFRSQKPAAP